MSDERVRQWLSYAAEERFGMSASKAQLDAWVERVAAMPLEQVVVGLPPTVTGMPAQDASITLRSQMIKQAPSWSLESPGVLRLDGTPFTVMHNEEDEIVRWLVCRNAQKVRHCFELSEAKANAERYADELREVGLLEAK